MQISCEHTHVTQKLAVFFSVKNTVLTRLLVNFLQIFKRNYNLNLENHPEILIRHIIPREETTRLADTRVRVLRDDPSSDRRTNE